MKKPNIAVLTPPISKAGNIPLSNLVDILHSLSNDLYLITGNDGYTFFKGDNRIHTYGILHERGVNVFTRILRCIYTELRISCKLAEVAENVDIWIFFMGGETLLPPMLTAKLLRKKVVLAFAGSSIENLKSASDNLFKPLEILSKINCTFSNRIILYSENLIKEWNLEKYENKIYIAHRHFLDFDKFKIKKSLNDRGTVVGYIGRLSEEKGILNFIKAIPEVLEGKSNVRFLIGGDGNLKDKIEEYLRKNNIEDKVELLGWIPRDKLPQYLNELKLVVLPSYTEGLPNLMLEAMACGTPVLATPVGAIPDVITDRETGFIMENNSPACIAENVIRVLEHPNLDKTVKNAKELVEKEFTYEAAAERYREILEGL